MFESKKHKIITLIVVVGLLSFFQAGIPVEASEDDFTISYTFTVEEYDIYRTDQGDEIRIDGFGHKFETGKPDMPSKIFTIAIPPQARVINIDYLVENSIVLSDTYEVIPCGIPQIIGETEPDEDQQDIFDDNFNQVYTSDDPYPSSIVEFERDSHYRKYDLVDIRINPMVYYPLSKTLEYFPEITVIITYQPTDDQPDIINDNLERTEANAKDIICNYHQAQQWYASSNPSTRGLYDFVIITLDSLTSSVDSLVDWETAKGRNVNVVTTSWIDANYDGYDLQEKMRNFLREKYPSEAWGIEDILLIGHYDDVPIRRTAQNIGYGQPETDYYYAELSLPDDQSWDANGNHQYGEDSDPIDFYTEVNVGRFPSSSPSIVSNMCSKTVSYEQNLDESYKKNILLLGAFFWSNTDNAVLMEEIASQSWMSGWTKTRMYEQAQSSYSSDYDLIYDNVETDWSSNTYGFVNWAGHGSSTACYEYYPSQAFVDTNTCDSLNDNYPAIIFADACSNHDTDDYNIGQAMLEQGGVGFVGSTKVAYGEPGWNGPYDGSSQSFDYFFTTCVTSGDYSTGQAHQWALKEMYTYGLWTADLKYETFEWGAYLGNPNVYMMLYFPELAYSPTTHHFGVMASGETDFSTFDIWNNDENILTYTLSETCDWIDVSPLSGDSNGEHDTITVTADTTGLSPGTHQGNIYISSNGGDGIVTVYVYINNSGEVMDISQENFDRGFPNRHTVDGDWGAAQDFLPTFDTISVAEIYLRKFGTPEFDLTVELHKDSPEGPFLDRIVFPVEELQNNWKWIILDFDDVPVETGIHYFIVITPAPSEVTTSFGYEWGYAFGNQYDDGSFWFTRDGGGLWRDLPTMYEFVFRTYGIQ